MAVPDNRFAPFFRKIPSSKFTEGIQIFGQSLGLRIGGISMTISSSPLLNLNYPIPLLTFFKNRAPGIHNL
jgi:hypothetical protein